MVDISVPGALEHFFPSWVLNIRYRPRFQDVLYHIHNNIEMIGKVRGADSFKNERVNDRESERSRERRKREVDKRKMKREKERE